MRQNALTSSRCRSCCYTVRMTDLCRLVGLAASPLLAPTWLTFRFSPGRGTRNLPTMTRRAGSGLFGSGFELAQATPNPRENSRQAAHWEWWARRSKPETLGVVGGNLEGFCNGESGEPVNEDRREATSCWCLGGSGRVQVHDTVDNFGHDKDRGLALFDSLKQIRMVGVLLWQRRQVLRKLEEILQTIGCAQC